MKEIKDLSTTDKLLLSSGCEPFFICYKKNPKYNIIYNQLVTYFSKKYEKELWTFITSCSKALRYGSDRSQISLDKNNFTTANKLQEQSISYKKFKEVIVKLDELGIITLYKGYYKHEEDRFRSFFVMSDYLLDLFKGIEHHGLKRDYSSFVEVKRDDGSVIVKNNIRGLKAVREQVIQYNNHMASYKIDVSGSKPLPIFKRVFFNTLEDGGRWYSQNSLQTIKSNNRELLTIDSQPCTEWDYSSTHPRLCAEMLGVTLPTNFDPYDVVVDGISGDRKEVRDLLKVCVMCMLFNSNRKSCISAVIDKVRLDRSKPEEDQDFSTINFSEGAYANVVDTLYTHNTVISEFFYQKDLWKLLQNKDSQICTYILMKFVELGKPILPYHDSFVVWEDDSFLLKDLMYEAWHSIMGSNNNCKVDKKW